MSDLRPFLDREARGIRPTHDALDSIVRQVDRRRGIRRVAAGAVALALAGGGIGLAYAAFSPDRDVRPAGPAPGPTPSPNPAPSPEGEAPSAPLRIEIRSGVGEPAAGDAASALISGLGGVGGRVFQPTWEGEQAREPSPTTTIHCPPTLDHVAAELRAALFPDARIGPLLPGGSFDLRVVIGEDWVGSNPDAVSAARIVGDFMTARHVDRGAERYLSDDAADEYRTGHGGLSLYGYTGADERSQHAITAMYPSEDRSFVVVVGITYRDADTVGHETLTVGDDPEDGVPEILAAELNEDPSAGADDGPRADEVQGFVEGFLQARRQASGAGTYLGEEARRAYAAHQHGLDLLGYATGDALTEARVVQYDRLSPARHRVVVRFSGSEEAGSRAVWETLLIGWRHGEVLVVLDAERGGRPG